MYVLGCSELSQHEEDHHVSTGHQTSSIYLCQASNLSDDANIPTAVLTNDSLGATQQEGDETRGHDEVSEEQAIIAAEPEVTDHSDNVESLEVPCDVNGHVFGPALPHEFVARAQQVRLDRRLQALREWLFLVSGGCMTILKL